MEGIRGKHLFCSWSGGKDCCLALFRAIRNGGVPAYLLTMLTEEGNRSRAHGLPPAIIQAQAQALNIPLVVGKASWNGYEKSFLSAITRFREEGIEYGVFGDIDLEAHLQWVERICSSVGIQAYEPLWKRARGDLLEEFLRLGFKATIISVKQGALDSSFLGQTLNRELIADIEKIGIDASGEEGEYHTVVTDGPIFSSPILLNAKERVLREGYCFLDVSIRKAQ